MTTLPRHGWTKSKPGSQVRAVRGTLAAWRAWMQPHTTSRLSVAIREEFETGSEMEGHGIGTGGQFHVRLVQDVLRASMCSPSHGIPQVAQ
jgi:hypothetical protein